MQFRKLILALLAVAFSIVVARAEMPPNVKCAIVAQEKARSVGSDYQTVYNRNFELCMLNTMPRERQTIYLIEKLKPYEAISPRPEKQTITMEQPKSSGTWVRLSPNHWVLQRN